MSIFPTKILLDTDGSEEATLAARTAVDLAHKTDSELHVVNVGLQDYGYPSTAYQTLSTCEEYRRKLRRRLENYWMPRSSRSKLPAAV